MNGLLTRITRLAHISIHKYVCICTYTHVKKPVLLNWEERRVLASALTKKILRVKPRQLTSKKLATPTAKQKWYQQMQKQKYQILTNNKNKSTTNIKWVQFYLWAGQICLSPFRCPISLSKTDTNRRNDVDERKNNDVNAAGRLSKGPMYGQWALLG